EDYKNYFRMSDENLKYMLAKVKQDTLLWNAITPEERIVATLRFLATGRSFEDPKFATIISPQALGKIIPETCKAIYTYKALKQEHLKFANSSIEWQKIAKDFENMNFVFVADEAFALRETILNHFPHKDLTHKNKFSTEDYPAHDVLSYPELKVLGP
ncbi:hypothetical protein B7P43_G17751, partial [Cryptotermes secundus]